MLRRQGAVVRRVGVVCLQKVGRTRYLVEGAVLGEEDHEEEVGVVRIQEVRPFSSFSSWQVELFSPCWRIFWPCCLLVYLDTLFSCSRPDESEPLGSFARLFDLRWSVSNIAGERNTLIDNVEMSSTYGLRMK